MIQTLFSRFNDKEKRILYIAIFILLLALVDRLFLSPAMSQLKSLEEQIREQKNSIKKDLRFLLYKDKILQENRSYQKYFVEEIKSEEEITAAFLKALESLASQAKVNLIKVTPSEGKQQRGYREYAANLDCSGSLEQVVTFMHLIDSSPDLLKMKKFNMAPRSATSDELTASMVVTKIIVEANPAQSEEGPRERTAPKAVLSEEE